MNRSQFGKLICAAGLAATLLGVPSAQAAPAPPVQSKIVFLGDSITYAGTYIELLETALRAEFPKRPWEIINVGLPSETVSGLSEAGHAGGKFPRPCALTRIDKVLELTKPELLVICYGMNCGIYHPHSPARMKAYQNGILTLREKAKAAGAQVLHLTPPPFDPKPIRNRLLPAGSPSYPQPFEEYDDVLDRFSSWLVDRRSGGWSVVDVHTYFHAALKTQRQAAPNFTFSPDGVHPNTDGHAVMAQAVLTAWNMDSKAATLASAEETKGLYTIVSERNKLMKDAWLTAVGHERPGMKAGLPLAAARDKEQALLAEIQLRLPRSPATKPAP